MGIAVIGGLVCGGALTLFVIPAMYALLSADACREQGRVGDSSAVVSFSEALSKTDGDEMTEKQCRYVARVSTVRLPGCAVSRRAFMRRPEESTHVISEQVKAEEAAKSRRKGIAQLD